MHVHLVWLSGCDTHVGMPADSLVANVGKRH